MLCPVDRVQMHVHAGGELDVESCPRCSGVWVHHRRFVAFKSLRHLFAETDGLRDSLRAREGGVAAAEVEPGPCPSCGGELHARDSEVNVSVSACVSCGGAWVGSEAMGELLWDPPPLARAESDAPSDASPASERARFDRFSFNHPLVFVLALPVSTVVAWVLNSTFLAGLMRPFHIWIHECGHATIAWLSGRRALPLPIGWTSWQPERSVVVYLALLFLLGVLFHTALKERLRGAMIFAAVVAVVQTLMTWTLSQQTVELWITFGGIGGEFYLSALLMILFYFPMPDRFRWDFWRYLVLIIAASTFWENVAFWGRVERGRENIPWGSILSAGDAGGDMDRLVLQHGWSSTDIIGTYNGLGMLCLLVLLGVYVAFLIQQRERILPDIRSRLGLGTS